MALENHKLLINSVLVTLICGMILSFIGNYILKSSNFRLASNNVTTCDKKVLKRAAELSATEQHIGNNGYIMAFTGNVILIVGIIFLLLLSVLFISKKPMTTMGSVMKMISGSLPAVLTLGVMSYLIIINSIYRSDIIQGLVADEYYTYSSLSTLLIIMQIGLLIKNIMDISSNQKSRLKYVVYILSVINFIMLGIIQVILEFFTTDG